MMDLFLLMAGAVVFLGYGVPGFLITLTAVLLVFLAGSMIPKKRWVMPCSAAAVSLMLLVLKLQPIGGVSLAAPLGFSYLALRLISYLVDVHKGQYPPEKNLFRFLLCMTFLPAAFLGPVERYDRMYAAVFGRCGICWDTVSAGLARLTWGLFKKLCIASRAAVLVSTISGEPEQYSGCYALAAMVLYSVQLYADFSGGMDMVLGVCRMLGIRLSENFDSPFSAQSVSEFWRRWHITLGAFLRDYVYIPLGGSRKGACRRVLAVLAAFGVSGLWHGRQYVLWGLLHGLLVAFGGRLRTGKRFLDRTVTFALVSVLWAFFIWPDAGTALGMILSLFRDFGSSLTEFSLRGLGLAAGEWIALVLSVLALGLCQRHGAVLRDGFERLSPAGRTAVLCAGVLVILVFGMYGIGFQVDAFIYSRF